MPAKLPTSLLDAIRYFSDLDVCAEYVARLRWPGGPVCPKCGRPGRRLTEPDQPLPQRQVTTQAGEVTLNREQWRCTTCRVVFFPLGPEAAVGHGGL